MSQKWVRTIDIDREVQIEPWRAPAFRGQEELLWGNREVRGKPREYQKQIKKVDILRGVSLGRMVIGKSDKVSRVWGI